MSIKNIFLLIFVCSVLGACTLPRLEKETQSSTPPATITSPVGVSSGATLDEVRVDASEVSFS